MILVAMAPRAAGSVGHVPHAGGAAARLSGGLSGAGNRGARLPHAQQTRTWPRASALIWHVWGGFQPRTFRGLSLPMRHSWCAQQGHPRVSVLTVAHRESRIYSANGAPAGA